MQRVIQRPAGDSRSRKRTGAVATEAALVIPTLLMFGLASADFGRVAHVQQIVTNAARTAADVAATQQFTPLTRGAWEARVRAAAAEELMNDPNFDHGQMQFSVTTETDVDGVTIVTIRVAAPFLTAIDWPGVPHDILLHSTVTARQFR